MRYISMRAEGTEDVELFGKPGFQNKQGNRETNDQKISAPTQILEMTNGLSTLLCNRVLEDDSAYVHGCFKRICNIF